MLRDGLPSAALMRAAERWGLASILWRTSKKVTKWKNAVAKSTKCWMCSKRVASGLFKDHVIAHIRERRKPPV